MALPGYLMVDLITDLKIETQLGSGGFSTVYNATVLSDELKQRVSSQVSVALKVIKGTLFK